MKPTQRQFALWIPLPVLWVALWWVVVYQNYLESSQSETPVFLGLDFVRTVFIIALTFTIGFSRHFFFGRRTLPLQLLSSDHEIFTGQRWSCYLPEISTFVLYFAISFLLSYVVNYSGSFWIIFFLLLLLELPCHFLPAPSPIVNGTPNVEISEENGSDSESTSDRPTVVETEDSTSNESLLSSVAAESTSSELDAEEEMESWTGQLTVSYQDDGQMSQQWVWVHHWKPDQLQTDLHMNFCPVFEKVPNVDVKIVDGPGNANLKKTVVQGIHLQMVRTAGSEEEYPTTILVSATQG